MLDAFEGEFNFLKFLSILAFLTTVGLFFCGIPICRQIWKRKDTNEISGAPFLMGVLGGTCWCVYGYLKKDATVLYVTGAQIVLYSTYTVFYWFMTKKKLWISIKVFALVVVCSSLVAMVHFFGHKVFHPLGIICMTLNTMDFAAPLAGLRVVLRRRATSTLPLPLCIANFMVSSEWFLYGLLVKDFYLITPNGIGSLLAFAQLILFVVLPRKPNQRAPFLRLYDRLRGCCMDNSLDLEAAAVVPVEKSIDKLGIHRISRQRWSSRVITNVAGEVENVIQKVQLGDQFGYSGKLNKRKQSDDESGGSTDSTLSPEEERKVGAGAFDKSCNGNGIEPKCQQETAFDQSLDFGQSGKSLKLNAKNLQKLAATFGGAFEQTAGTGQEEEDEEELMSNAEEEDEEGDDGMKQEEAMDEEDDKAGEEVVFPITIRDASQLLRLSRRFSKKRHPHNKKAVGGFGRSLQQQHYKAMRQRHQQQQNDDVPIIVEEEDDAFNILTARQQRIKRASSEPSLVPQPQQKKQQPMLTATMNLTHFERF